MENNLTREQAEAVQAFLADSEARMGLYWILDKNGERQRFKLNWAQRELHRTAHLRNNILKVRQLGMSTYMAMRILDSCLFTPNFKAGIVDKTLDDASAKLKKIEFAYNNLDYVPPYATELDRELAAIGALIKAEFGKPNFTQKYAEFANGSRIDVGASLRGGTMQLLHISELGSVSIHDPVRAEEIKTGAFNTVGKDCQMFLESTHEGGKYGVNYDLLIQAMDCIGRELAPTDFKFYFFPWYSHPEYTIDAKFYSPTAEDETYFNGLERDTGCKIDAGRRAWYCSIRRTQGSKMRQEYPSTAAEAINPIMEGTIYAEQIEKLRERGHLKAKFAVDRIRPLYASWDIGVGDFMSIWFIQPDGVDKFLLVDCFTANNKELSFYVDEVRRREALWGKKVTYCVTPHDGARRDYNLMSFDQSLRDAGFNVIRVPRTQNIWEDIDITRDFLNDCVIHERCSEKTIVGKAQYISGVDALTNYRTLPAGSNGSLKTTPLHDQCSHACDALRCFAVGLKRKRITLYGYGGNGMAEPSEVASWRPHQSSYVQNFLS